MSVSKSPTDLQLTRKYAAHYAFILAKWSQAAHIKETALVFPKNGLGKWKIYRLAYISYNSFIINML